MHPSHRRTDARDRTDAGAARTDSRASGATEVEIRANRLQVIERLVADLAHEIKNPLNAVVINLELLKRRIATGSTDEALDRADRVGEEMGRVHTLVDGLFRLMRPDREPEPPVGIARVLDEVVPLIRLQAKIARATLAYHPDDRNARVAMHPIALKQVVLNLVANSLDALEPAGGSIELATVRAADTVRLRLHDDAAARAGAEPDRLAVVRSLAGQAGGSFERGEGDDAGFVLTLPVHDG